MKRMGSGAIDPQKLHALMGTVLDARASTSEINKEAATDVRAAVLTEGLHSRAFNLCVSLARMDQVKRVAFLAAFDDYRAILEIDAAPQQEMFEDQNGKSAA